MTRNRFKNWDEMEPTREDLAKELEGDREKYFEVLGKILGDGENEIDRYELKTLNGLFGDYLYSIEKNLMAQEGDLLMESEQRKAGDLREILEKELDGGNEIGVFVHLFRYLEQLRKMEDRVAMERDNARRAIEQILSGDEEVQVSGIWIIQLSDRQKKMILEEIWRVYLTNLSKG